MSKPSFYDEDFSGLVLASLIGLCVLVGVLSLALIVWGGIL